MSYSLIDVENELSGMLHGTTTNSITNLFGVYYRAARKVQRDLDVQETIRIVEFANPIYNSIYDYAIPSDLKGNAVIDIRPQVNRLPGDQFLQQYNQDFDLWKSTSLTDAFTVQWNTGVKTARINAPWIVAPVVINEAINLSSNGTWAVGGGANNLSVSNIYSAVGSSSITFDLDISGSGYIECTGMDAIDLTQNENQAQQFWLQYLPTGSDFTAMELRWGSSSSDYWSATVTADFNVNAWVNGWNTNGVPWASASSTGSPDASSVTYLRVTYTYSTVQTGVHINSFTSNLGAILELEYYSKDLFSSAAGAFKEKPTLNSDLVNLDTETYDVFVYQVALQAALQLQDGGIAQIDVTSFKEQYDDAVRRYRALYKSQKQKPQSVYYAMNRRNRDNWSGNRFW